MRFAHSSFWRPLACVLVLSIAPLALSQKTYTTPNAPLLGAAWYPEQWPESRWDVDLTLMQRAHFDVVRIGEFAWSTMEPSEGRYDFAWLDRAIALAGRHHIAVVLGTPTDAPPAWLTAKYPQTLRVDENGVRAQHGNRRQFNYANIRYRRFCADIVRQMARRYGHNPDVIGWQIGNEFTDESFDSATRTLFQQFLRNKYKTLTNLNAHWATAYWSQTYSAWSQIPLPAHGGNPGLLLEHKHFVTATWGSFQRNQIDVLRPVISASQFITTNIGGLAWSDNWDHYAMTADLNLVSWDDYVGQGHLDPPRNAMLNDFARGWRRQNFWIMETQPGSVDWAPINNMLFPGETRALAWQDVGHGADAILYWQWRSALNGQEQYHGAIVGPDGNPNPIYSEIRQLGADFLKTRDALAGTSPHASVAILHTYDSRWAIDFQPHTRRYDQQQVLLRFYKPLDQIAQSNGEAVDIVDPTRGPISQYDLIVAPSLNLIPASLAATLLDYVQQGGHLLLGPRSGMKDEFNSLNSQGQPGPLVPALRAKVEQYYALDHTLGLAATSGSFLAPLPNSASADIWAEQLKPFAQVTRTDMLYTDPGGWLDHQPAMLTRSIGRGTLSYLGTLPDASTLDIILKRLATNAGIRTSNPSPPDGFELSERQRADGSHRVFIVINHNNAPGHITLPSRYHNLLDPETSSSPQTTLNLAAQGVAVLIPEDSR